MIAIAKTDLHSVSMKGHFWQVFKGGRACADRQQNEGLHSSWNAERGGSRVLKGDGCAGR